MNKIVIPFMPKFGTPMLSGQKTATSRTKLYGYAGDYFEAFGRIFILTDVRYIHLDTISHLYFREEGFESPNGFIATWRRLHPRKLFDRGQRVYFHQFKLQSELLPPFHVHELEGGCCLICGLVPLPVEAQESLPL